MGSLACTAFAYDINSNSENGGGPHERDETHGIEKELWRLSADPHGVR
jgi:hypothetical protein